MTQERRIVLNIVATYWRLVYSADDRLVLRSLDGDGEMKKGL